MPLQDPPGVVLLFEGHQCLSQLLDSSKGSHPQQVFLEQADEALGTAIALGLTDETGGRLDTEDFELPLEVVGHVGRPMIMAHRQADGDLLMVAPEVLAHPLTNRLQRLGAIARGRGMGAHTFKIAVIDADGECLTQRAKEAQEHVSSISQYSTNRQWPVYPAERSGLLFSPGAWNRGQWGGVTPCPAASFQCKRPVIPTC